MRGSSAALGGGCERGALSVGDKVPWTDVGLERGGFEWRMGKELGKGGLELLFGIGKFLLAFCT